MSGVRLRKKVLFLYFGLTNDNMNAKKKTISKQEQTTVIRLLWFKPLLEYYIGECTVSIYIINIGIKETSQRV